jgi:hypothetical protein
MSIKEFNLVFSFSEVVPTFLISSSLISFFSSSVKIAIAFCKTKLPYLFLIREEILFG